MTGAAKRTVLKLLADIGAVCDDYQDKTLRGLSVTPRCPARVRGMISAAPSSVDGSSQSRGRCGCQRRRRFVRQGDEFAAERAADGVFEIRAGLDACELRALDERIQDRGGFGAAFGAGAKVIDSADHGPTQRTLSSHSGWDRRVTPTCTTCLVLMSTMKNAKTGLNQTS